MLAIYTLITHGSGPAPLAPAFVAHALLGFAAPMGTHMGGAGVWRLVIGTARDDSELTDVLGVEEVLQTVVDVDALQAT